MKFRALLGSLMLAFASFGFVTAAAPASAVSCDYTPGSWNTWAQLQNMVNVSTAGQTICFQSDWTIGQSLAIPSGKDIVLDIQGHTVTFNAQADKAGIEVPVGAALTIKDSVGTGTLTANAGSSYGSIIGGAAGIGGSSSSTATGQAAGHITILGGTVNATGGLSGDGAGAGIGGGGASDSMSGQPSTGGAGGIVEISGGTVYAIGGHSVADSYRGTGAGIGGGGAGIAQTNGQVATSVGGAGGTVTIHGGSVTARGGDRDGTSDAGTAAGIGGGSAGTTIAMSSSASAIGGAGATVTINGGRVTATAGSGDSSSGAGIGSGAAASCFGQAGGVSASGAVGTLTIAGEQLDSALSTAGSGFDYSSNNAGGSAAVVSRATGASGTYFTQSGSANATSSVSATARITFSYAATFDAAGGSSVSSQRITYNNQVTQPTAPTRAGYTFTGWTVNSAPYVFSSAVKAPVSLTAAWTAAAVSSSGASDSALADTGRNSAPLIGFAALFFLSGLTLVLFRRKQMN